MTEATWHAGCTVAERAQRSAAPNNEDINMVDFITWLGTWYSHITNGIGGIG